MRRKFYTHWYPTPISKQNLGHVFIPILCMLRIGRQNCESMFESLYQSFHYPVAPWPLRCNVLMYNVIVFAQLIEINIPLRAIIGKNVFRNIKFDTTCAFNWLTLLARSYYFYCVGNNICWPLPMFFLFQNA